MQHAALTATFGDHVFCCSTGGAEETHQSVKFRGKQRQILRRPPPRVHGCDWRCLHTAARTHSLRSIGAEAAQRCVAIHTITQSLVHRVRAASVARRRRRPPLWCTDNSVNVVNHSKIGQPSRNSHTGRVAKTAVSYTHCIRTAKDNDLPAATRHTKTTKTGENIHSEWFSSNVNTYFLFICTFTLTVLPCFL